MVARSCRLTIGETLTTSFPQGLFFLITPSFPHHAFFLPSRHHTTKPTTILAHASYSNTTNHMLHSLSTVWKGMYEDLTVQSHCQSGVMLLSSSLHVVFFHLQPTNSPASVAYSASLLCLVDLTIRFDLTFLVHDVGDTDRPQLFASQSHSAYILHLHQHLIEMLTVVLQRHHGFRSFEAHR